MSLPCLLCCPLKRILPSCWWAVRPKAQPTRLRLTYRRMQRCCLHQPVSIDPKFMPPLACVTRPSLATPQHKLRVLNFFLPLALMSSARLETCAALAPHSNQARPPTLQYYPPRFEAFCLPIVFLYKPDQLRSRHRRGQTERRDTDGRQGGRHACAVVQYRLAHACSVQCGHILHLPFLITAFPSAPGCLLGVCIASFVAGTQTLKRK